MGILDNEDQWYSSPPHIAEFIRKECNTYSTKTSYFTHIFTELMTHGFCTVEPLTAKQIDSMISHLEYRKENLNQNGR